MIRKYIPLFLLFYSFGFSWIDPNSEKMQEANEAYKKKQYDKAEKIYRNIEKENKSKSSENDIANYNLGNSLYQQGKYKEAIEQFYKAAQSSDPAIRQKALNNLGNSFAKSGDKKKALESYRSALEENNTSSEARRNIERLFSQPKKQEQQQSESNQNKEKSQQKQSKSKSSELSKTDKKLAENLIKEASKNSVQRKMPATRENLELGENPY